MIIDKEIDNIDKGGFGIVDKVLCADGNEYARKTFSMNIPHDENLKQNALQRFKREATFQASFSHKNIVPILFSDLEVDDPYYIMPLAAKSLKKIKLETKEEKIRMLLDVMAGLEEMHDKSYYHRDLKPGNILRFYDENGNAYYSIGDFGLLAIDQTNITELTPISMIKGSDYYTAPEIVESMARASIQSDIFSVGCLIHDLFGKGNRIPCQPILEDGAIGIILSSCTHKKPLRRYKSIGYLREAFISISNEDLEMKSAEGQRLLEVVESNNNMNYKDWENIIEFLCNENNNSHDMHSLFKAINISRINEMINVDVNFANSYGILFSDWVRETNFIYDFCDIIGRRLELFIENCNMNTKSQCIISMLYMGTSHNRFYVEEITNKWLRSTENNLAERLSLEIITEGKNICQLIAHLEHSIRVSRSNFNPIILETINKICKPKI